MVESCISSAHMNSSCAGSIRIHISGRVHTSRRGNEILGRVVGWLAMMRKERLGLVKTGETKWMRTRRSGTKLVPRVWPPTCFNKKLSFFVGNWTLSLSFSIPSQFPDFFLHSSLSYVIISFYKLTFNSNTVLVYRPLSLSFFLLLIHPLSVWPILRLSLSHPLSSPLYICVCVSFSLTDTPIGRELAKVPGIPEDRPPVLP